MYSTTSTLSPSEILGFGNWHLIQNASIRSVTNDSLLTSYVGNDYHNHACDFTKLTTDQIPQHTHEVTGYTSQDTHHHNVNGYTNMDGWHVHSYVTNNGYYNVDGGSSRQCIARSGILSDPTDSTGIQVQTNDSQHYHHFDVNSTDDTHDHTFSVVSASNVSNEQGHNHAISTDYVIPRSYCVKIYERVQ